MWYVHADLMLIIHIIPKSCYTAGGNARAKQKMEREIRKQTSKTRGTGEGGNERKRKEIVG